VREYSTQQLIWQSYFGCYCLLQMLEILFGEGENSGKFAFRELVTGYGFLFLIWW